MSNYAEYKLGNSNACSLVGRPQKGFQAWRRHTQPLTFERCFLIGVRRMEKKGAEFDFLCPGLVKKNGLVNLQSLERLKISRGNTKTNISLNSNTFFSESGICCAPLLI
jgi:hypothetical protein